MTEKKSIAKTRGGIEIAGEAFHLVRMAPAHVIAGYYVGSAPFVLAFLYFWSDMSRSAFAYRRCFEASLALAALFVWMKCWQSVFAVGLRSHIAGNPSPRWTLRGVAGLIARQTATQPYGLLLIPAALLLTIPFHMAHAFYQNLTVMETADGHSSAKELCRRAWRQAVIWPKQNYVVIWLLSPWLLAVGLLIVFGAVWALLALLPDLMGVSREFGAMRKLFFVLFFVLFLFQLGAPLSPFGCVIAGNIAIAMVYAPMLVHFLLGVETTFTLSGVNAIVNVTFLLSVYGISYLVLDPFNKAAHALRCFYGESQTSGEDLLVELGSLSGNQRLQAAACPAGAEGVAP